jgi:hypothetical protein
MTTTRPRLSLLFVTVLVLSGALASFGTSHAKAREHTDSDPYECDTSPSKDKLGEAALPYVEACKGADVRTFGDVRKLMKGWWKTARGKSLQAADGTTLIVKSCRACHPDANGMKGTRKKAYKFFSVFMKSGEPH